MALDEDWRNLNQDHDLTMDMNVSTNQRCIFDYSTVTISRAGPSRRMLHSTISVSYLRVPYRAEFRATELMSGEEG
jgi:hypothetical protein